MPSVKQVSVPVFSYNRVNAGKAATREITNSEVQFYDRWRKLQMRACCRSGKPPFSSEEET